MLASLALPARLPLSSTNRSRNSWLVRSGDIHTSRRLAVLGNACIQSVIRSGSDTGLATKLRVSVFSQFDESPVPSAQSLGSSSFAAEIGEASPSRAVRALLNRLGVNEICQALAGADTQPGSRYSV